MTPERNCSSFYAMHSLVLVMRRLVRGYLPPLVLFQVCARPAPPRGALVKHRLTPTKLTFGVALTGRWKRENDVNEVKQGKR
jgi:hypothetical protein